MAAIPSDSQGEDDHSRRGSPHMPIMRHLPSASTGSSEMARGLANTEILMSPDLWANLPDDLIDIIIHKILVDLPFSRQRSFCRVSEKWMNFLLSAHYFLCYEKGKCNLFNPRRDEWEVIPLDFGPVQGNTLQHLELVSVNAGLLTFVNKLNGEFLVCNPLTQRNRNLGRWKRPRGHQYRLLTKGLVLRDFVIPSERGRAVPLFAPYLFFDVGITGSKNPFKLSMRTFDDGTVIVFDSRSSSFRSEGQKVIREEFWFTVNGPILHSPPAVIVGLALDTQGSKVLIYDLKDRLCRWTTSQNALLAIQSTGKMLAICSRFENGLKFFEVHGTGVAMTLVESPSSTLPPSLQNVAEEMILTLPDDVKERLPMQVLLNVKCSSNGHAVFFVAEVRGESRYLEVQYDSISVRTNIQQRSGHVPNWKRLGAPTNPSMGSSVGYRNFHAFKPSVARP